MTKAFWKTPSRNLKTIIVIIRIMIIPWFCRLYIRTIYVHYLLNLCFLKEARTVFVIETIFKLFHSLPVHIQTHTLKSNELELELGSDEWGTCLGHRVKGGAKNLSNQDKYLMQHYTNKINARKSMMDTIHFFKDRISVTDFSFWLRFQCGLA